MAGPVPTPSPQVGRGQPKLPMCQVARLTLGIPAGQAEGLTAQLLICYTHEFCRGNVQHSVYVESEHSL